MGDNDRTEVKDVLLTFAAAELERMPPDERVAFWVKLQAPYCKHCGYSDSLHTCKCWNDE